MAKLKKYNSFQTLKLDVKSSPRDSVEMKHRYNEMESFLELVRKNLSTRKEKENHSSKGSA